MKTLITYFSASGVTERVAERIASATGGDLFEIEPVELYTEEDLDWTNKESRSSIEMANRTSRPKVKNKVSNLNEYDKVVLGFPVWWDVAPTIVNTFIEENDLSGKNVFVFVTSGSSSVDNSFRDLKDTYKNINFIVGVRFNGNETEEEYINFIS